MEPENLSSLLDRNLARIVSSGVLPGESYLAGGTAVYYHLHHRLSVDLDFFTPKPFVGETLVFELREVFETIDVALMEKDTLILFLGPDKLKFSLFYLPYALLSPPISVKIGQGGVCPMASFEDLEAMKAIALVQRGSAKDFVDLYFLLERTGHSFQDLARLVRTKYGVDEEYEYQMKTAMVYFDDAEKELDAIRLVGGDGEPRIISGEKWTAIKDSFARFCR